MRVTKAIREYVEDEIRKKYEKAIDEIGKDYKEERNKVIDHIREIANEAGKKAIEYIKSCGFEYRPGYREDCVFTLQGSIQKNEEETKINNEMNRFRNERMAKIKQVLFDLEMGETEKSKLKEVLDNITVD